MDHQKTPSFGLEFFLFSYRLVFDKPTNICYTNDRERIGQSRAVMHEESPSFTGQDNG